PTAPVEEDSIDGLHPRCQRSDQRGGDFPIAIARREAEPSKHRLDERLVEAPAPLCERFGQGRGFGDEAETSGELREVPVDCLGLPAEGVQAIMVEISCGEVRVPMRREAPRAVIEAFAGDIDVVAVEHAMDEAGGEVGCGERRGCAADEVEQPERVLSVVGARLFGIKMFKAVAGEFFYVLGLTKEGEALEGADPDMSVA